MYHYVLLCTTMYYYVLIITLQECIELFRVHSKGCCLQEELGKFQRAFAGRSPPEEGPLPWQHLSVLIDIKSKHQKHESVCSHIVTSNGACTNWLPSSFWLVSSSLLSSCHWQVHKLDPSQEQTRLKTPFPHVGLAFWRLSKTNQYPATQSSNIQPWGHIHLAWQQQAQIQPDQRKGVPWKADPECPENFLSHLGTFGKACVGSCHRISYDKRFTFRLRCEGLQTQLFSTSHHGPN